MLFKEIKEDFTWNYRTQLFVSNLLHGGARASLLLSFALWESPWNGLGCSARGTSSRSWESKAGGADDALQQPGARPKLSRALPCM